MGLSPPLTSCSCTVRPERLEELGCMPQSPGNLKSRFFLSIIWGRQKRRIVQIQQVSQTLLSTVFRGEGYCWATGAMQVSQRCSSDSS